MDRRHRIVVGYHHQVGRIQVDANALGIQAVQEFPQAAGRLRPRFDGEPRALPVGILGQAVARLLHDFIGVAAAVRRHHADMGGHHPAPQLQGQVHNPLGTLDFAGIVPGPGKAMPAQVAAERRNFQPVVRQQPALERDGLRGLRFRGHLPFHRIQLHAVRAQFPAFFQALGKRQLQGIRHDSNRKRSHCIFSFSCCLLCLLLGIRHYRRN